MHSWLGFTFALLSIIQVTSGAASNSYVDCLAVAARFATTINGSVPNITATNGINVTCSLLTNVSCPGSIQNGVCTWQRKLSVTCINASIVRIRVQSNGLPGRCASLPLLVTFVEVNIDFEVNFNPNVNVNTPLHSVSTPADLNNLVCNVLAHQQVPSTSNFISNRSISIMNTLVGVAIDNVVIFNPNSANNVDAFYPTGNFSVETVDECLSTCDISGTYHYRLASQCMIRPPVGNISTCAQIPACSSSIANYSIQDFASSARNLTVIGIAKDGHIIYGPYTSAGIRVTTGVDICNGMFFDSIGNYGYFATMKYPYITGCFGPGNYPSFTPNCSTNPPSLYNMSLYALSFVVSTQIGCNNASLVQLSNGTCVPIVTAQITTVTTLRSNLTNATVMAMTLIDYLRVSAVVNSSTANGSLTVTEIENLIDGINDNVTVNDTNAFIMSQLTTETDAVLGVLFVSNVGGQIITNSTRANITNMIFSTAAIISPEYVSDITRLSILIIDTPSDYRRLNTTDNKSLASSVVIASIQRNINSLSDLINIDLYFQIKQDYKPTVSANYYCSFYDSNTSSWSESGCTNPPSYNSVFDRYECSCDHLTSFALIWLPISSSDTNNTTRPSLDSQDIGSLVFQLISIFCLLIIIIHSIITRRINPLFSPNVEELLPLLSCASTIILFIFYISLGLDVYINTESSNQTICFSSAIGLMFMVYFLIIFMFCIKTSFAFFNYRHFVRPFSQPALRLLGILFFGSFLISITIVSITAGLYSKSSLNIIQLYPYKICWFNRTMIYYFLTIPIGIFLLLNIIISIGLARELLSLAKQAPSTVLMLKRMKFMLLVLLASCVTQGLGWLFGPFLTFLDPTAGNILGWFFNIFNGLEGLWCLLLYYIIRQQRIDRYKPAPLPTSLSVVQQRNRNEDVVEDLSLRKSD